jgi:hypothetical protein
MLSKEKIEKNTKKFYDTGEKYGFINDKLVDILGPEFIGAPSCTSDYMHGAYEGGLINHILLTTKYAVSINGMLPEDKRVNLESLIKVCCLHQIGKAKLYIKSEEGWKIKRGDNYSFNNDRLNLNTSQQSLLYIAKAGIELSDGETYAIHNYNTDFGNSGLKLEGEKLAAILRLANQMAIIEEK